MKRIVDIIAAFIGVVILLPLFVIVGFLIWFQDGGPIFFIQKRVGKCRKPLYLYKFRSMRFLHNDTTGHFEPGNTTRVTPLGAIIRKTKIDELPQLINVLKGDMSIVGPRPEVEKWVNRYPERWDKVLTVNPGITDNASVIFRNEESLLKAAKNPEVFYSEQILPKKLDLYEAYVSNHSLWGDFKIIIKTIVTIFIK